MGRILKKNQIIITALAALIAVAGYLNHIESSEKKINTVSNEPEQTSGPDDVSLTGQDEGIEGQDIVSNDIDIEGEPGEAVFVNAVGTVDFIVEAKLLREQTRAQGKATLMEIVNNAELSEEEKKAAVEKIARYTDIAEREMAAENLISARGYENVVVTITDDAADVLIVADSLDAQERAQIEEIVKTKTLITADKITITAVKTN